MLNFRRRLTEGLVVIRNRTSTLLHRGHDDDDETGEIKEENLYKRGILSSIVKIGKVDLPLEERMSAAQTVGHLSWTGGPPASKLAGQYLGNFLWIINEESEPQKLKLELIKSISEICWMNQQNQEKARSFGVCEKLTKMLQDEDKHSLNMRRWIVYTLWCLLANNYENQTFVLSIPAMKSSLKKSLKGLFDKNWRCWERNEARELYMLLGLDK